MMTLKPGSILLGTTQPDVLRDWYRKTLAPEHTGEGPINLGGFLLVIDQRNDISPQTNEPGRIILNFHVNNFDEIEKQLRTANVEWITPAENRPTGRFATFTDPDGNYLQIIQFNRDA